MRWYLSSLEEIQGLAWDLKAFLHSPRENNNFGAVIEQFLDVSRLNAGQMISACLPPVPFSRSTRKKFSVFIRLGFSLNLEPSPGNMFDSRRVLLSLHNTNIVRQWSRG